MQNGILKISVIIVSLLIVAFLFSTENILIDFNTLKADGVKDKVLDPVSGAIVEKNTQNTETMVDYSQTAGASVPEEDKKLMKISLSPDNWDITLAPSSRSVKNRSLSFCREWQTKETAKQYPSTTILGARIHFPELPFNSWAIIEPPFEIPAYEKKTDENGNEVAGDPGTKFISKGVLRNVGIIKSITMTVYGRNFKHALAIVLSDENDNVQEYFITYLDFDGWSIRTWTNPNYILDVRNRDLFKVPLYPRNQPFLKLKGFRIYRNGENDGGDFVVYIKDVKVIYDEAVIDVEEDIDDETAWGILTKRREERKTLELTRIGQMQQLRFLEKRKMHNEATSE